MVESLWEDKTKAWLGWRAGKGGVWGGFSWKNGAVQFSTESTALTILLSLGGHQENQIGIEKQDKRSRKNAEQPVGNTAPTEKILKLEPKMVTKKITKWVQNTPSVSESCVQWVTCQWFWCVNLVLLKTSQVHAPKYPMPGSTKHIPSFCYFVWFSIDIFHHN